MNGSNLCVYQIAKIRKYAWIHLCISRFHLAYDVPPGGSEATYRCSATNSLLILNHPPKFEEKYYLTLSICIFSNELKNKVVHNLDINS